MARRFGDEIVLLSRARWHLYGSQGAPVARWRVLGCLPQARLPEVADRVELLVAWKQVSVLSVAADRLPRWYRPGLLLIGDAAHVMSPVAGVGINYAVLDAVVTANLLAEPLKAGRVRLRDLARVQRRREPSTRLVQAFQAQVQRRVVAAALNSDRQFAPPLPLRLLLRVPVLRTLPSRLVAFGIGRVHVKD